MNTSAPTAVVQLRLRVQCLEGRARDRRAVLPFGIKAIDDRLPEADRRSGLHEVAGGGNGAIDDLALLNLKHSATANYTDAERAEIHLQIINGFRRNVWR